MCVVILSHKMFHANVYLEWLCVQKKSCSFVVVVVVVIVQKIHFKKNRLENIVNRVSTARLTWLL